MGKCLVTKLNGTVNNDSLPKLGVVIIPIRPMEKSTTTDFRSTKEGSVTLKVYDNNKTLKGTYKSSISEHNWISINLPNGGYLEYDNKYDMVGGFFGNTQMIGREALPDIEEFKYCKNYTNFSCGAMKGNVKELAEFDWITFIDATYFTGDFTDYIARRVEKGTSSGSIGVRVFQGGEPEAFVGATIQINGIQVGAFNEWAYPVGKLVWESADKYYLLNDGHTKVYIHGYSSEEIQAMKESGQPFEKVKSPIEV